MFQLGTRLSSKSVKISWITPRLICGNENVIQNKWPDLNHSLNFFTKKSNDETMQTHNNYSVLTQPMSNVPALLATLTKAKGNQLRLALSVEHQRLKCRLCRGEHHLYGCDTFRRLDILIRQRKAKKLKVCDNYSRPNCEPERCTLRPCQNEGCGSRHNGLLCCMSARPTVNAVKESRQ